MHGEAHAKRAFAKGDILDKIVLRTALGKHAHVKPLQDGRVTSERLDFEWLEYEPLPKAFREMVRGGDIDLSEMAVITHLMAHHFEKPIVGLPIPLWWRLPHTNLVCDANGPIKGPEDLNGKRLGVRAYGQTSGVWVRGVLQHEFGVDLKNVTWGTMEDSHLAEYEDPANCTRYTPPPTLRELMLQGEFAAIMGERVVDPNEIRTVIPDAANVARAWIERSGINPVNHIVALRRELNAEHPWMAEELMRLFTEARQVAIEEDGIDAPPEYGYDSIRASVQCALDYSFEQEITPKRYMASDIMLQL